MDPSGFKHILVATDFSELADEALDTAIGLARVFGASVILVHVYAEPTYLLPPPVDMAPWEDITGRVMARIDESLNSRCQRVLAAGVACEAITLVGSPAVEIVRHAAESQASLIVLGTHGRGGVQHVLLGSTAERVVHRSRCPVLVIPRR